MPFARMLLDRLSDVIRRAARRPTAFFAAYAFWLCAERFVLGPASYLEMHDIGDSMIPRNIAVVRWLFEHGPSYWMPSTVGGVDRLAQTHSYLAPSALFCIVLPDWMAFSATLMAGAFLSAYFTFRVCREDLGLAAEQALFAGVVNVSVYSSELLITQWGYAAVPLAVWSLNRLRGKRPRLGGALLIGLGYSAASVFATSVPFCLSGMAVWFLLVQRETSFLFWARFATFVFGTCLLQVQAVWALLANLPYSQRAVADVGLPGSWADLPAVLRQGLGFVLAQPIPVVAIAGGIRVGVRDARFKPATGLFLAVAAGSALLSFSAAFLPEGLAAFRAYNFTRFNQLAPFFAGCAGAMGLAALGARRERFTAAAILCVLLLTAPPKSAAWRDWAFGGSIKANYESAVLRNAIPAAGAEPFRVATILHGIYPLYAGIYGWESVDGEANIYPRRLNRFWSRVIEPSAALRPALANQFKTFTDVGTRVQLSLDTVEYDLDGLPFHHYYRLSLLSLFNTRYLISRHPVLHPDLKPLLVQAPWESMSRAERLKLRLRENFSGKSYFYVYENMAALPRFFVAGSALVVTDDAAFEAWLDGMSSPALRDIVLLEKPLAVRLKNAPLKARVGVDLYSPDRIELSLTVDGVGMLVATNSFSPFWKCEVDGVAREILPAYGTFWGVVVGPADKKVVFSYDPPYSLRNILARLIPSN